jgi:nucleotide-binding universal stress UspA family protein
MKAVYATDLSDAIETAITDQTCLECLGRYGITEMHLLHVTSPSVTAGTPGGSVGNRVQSALQRQAEAIRAEGFDVELHTARGTPHRRINGLADQLNSDLMIVGSRGRSPLKRRNIGGTTRNVARTAVRPLLVQRIAAAGDDYEVANEHLFERVLYATDFSENAERAFEQFQFLQGATQEAHLLHVQHRSEEPGEDPQARLDELADDLLNRGIDVETSVREGVPAEEILAADAEYDPTTVLLGARGLSRMRRLLIGSVSEKVVARSDSNVLLVPPSRMR